MSVTPVTPVCEFVSAQAAKERSVKRVLGSGSDSGSPPERSSPKRAARSLFSQADPSSSSSDDDEPQPLVIDESEEPQEEDQGQG